jgi:hypothetical protein
MGPSRALKTLALAALTGALTLVVLPAAGQARPLHSTRCGQGSVAAVVNHRHVCLPFRPPSARALAGYLNSFGGWAPGVEPPALARLHWPSLQPFVNRVMGGVPAAPTAPGATPTWLGASARVRAATATGAAPAPTGSPAAAAPTGSPAAAAPTGSPTQISGTPPGSFDQSGLWFPPPGGVPGVPAGQSVTAEVQPYESPEGPGFGAKVRTVQTFPGGGSQGIDTNRGGIVDCPDRQGLSPGEMHQGETKFKQLSANGQKAWWRVTQSSDASIVARTNDQAKVFEYDMDATMTIAGTGYNSINGENSPTLVTGRVSLRHVPVGIGAHWFADDQYITSFSVNAKGIASSGLDRELRIMLSVLQSETDRMLDNVSGHWYGCLDMPLTPPSYTFAPRESHQVKALVTSKRTGSDTAAMDLKAKVYGGFTISPDHDVQGLGTPATFTVTAPATKPHYPYVFITGVGKQGTVTGELNLGFKAPSNVFDIEYKGSGNFWLDRTIYDPGSGTSSEQLYQGTPSWDTITRGVTFYPNATQWSTASDLGITEHVSGQANVTIDGSYCQTPIIDPTPGIGDMTNMRATSTGGMELILAGAYEYASPHTASCAFDMGPLNPGGSLIPSSSAGFDPTEASQIHLTVTKAELDAIGPGQSLQLPVQGPADPITLNPDCGSTGNVTCQQRLSFSGTVILTRHKS